MKPTASSKLSLLIKVLYLFLACSSVAAAAGSFTGIGHLPGGDASSLAAISPDGRYVGGDAASGSETHAVLWDTKTRKLTDLGTLSGYQESFVAGISKNGKVVVGMTRDEVRGLQAFRWTKAQGITGLGFLTGDNSFSRAQGLSADGSVVVGAAIATQGGSGFHAFRWTKKKGTVDLNQQYGIQQQFFPYGASANLKVLVGYTMDSDNNGVAVRWTAKDGLVTLGTVANSPGSYALGVSANGKVVVGDCVIRTDVFLTQACRWVGTGPAQGLGLISGHNMSMLYSTSRNGAVAVGLGLNNVPGQSATDSVAVIWDEAHGLRGLQDVLSADYGLDTSGWKLEGAMISEDGKTIVGAGTNPSGQKEGWVAKLKGK